jgi:copper resistance protein B
MRKTLWSAAVAIALTPLLLGTSVSAQEMKHSAEAMHEPNFGAILVDQLEYQWRDGKDATVWEADAYWGSDYNKVWFKTSGEYSDDTFEKAEFQLLYSRLLGYYWDIQGGIRHDLEPEPTRTYGVIGLQGLAPGYFEIDTQAFVSEKGDVSARLEAEYDLLITQKWVLQPKAELNVAASEDREIEVGRGINDYELGLRLRYEFSRKFAPYIGVNWEQKVGDTADFARAHGEDTSSLSFVTGIKFWF